MMFSWFVSWDIIGGVKYKIKEIKDIIIKVNVSIDMYDRIDMFWFGIRATKYENITNIPPI